MKNVMIYNVVEDKLRYDSKQLVKYLNAQVDNSLLRGWNPEDIIIGTNFYFEYKGIRNVPLEDVCTYNPFFNKFFGLLELINLGILGDDDIWFHDQDNWQINNIEFPDFSGLMAGCTYEITHQWNTGSLFLKKDSKVLLDFIVSFTKLLGGLKVSSDENIIAYLRNNDIIGKHFSSINSRYNVGCTGLECRYNVADKPVCVIALKPNDSWAISKFKSLDLIDPILDSIFINMNK